MNQEEISEADRRAHHAEVFGVAQQAIVLAGSVRDTAEKAIAERNQTLLREAQLKKDVKQKAVALFLTVCTFPVLAGAVQVYGKDLLLTSEVCALWALFLMCFYAYEFWKLAKR